MIQWAPYFGSAALAGSLLVSLFSLCVAATSTDLHLSRRRRRSMNFPSRHVVSCLGLLALGCQAFVVQPASLSSFSSQQQQLMFDDYQHKPTATAVRGFGDSLHDGVGVSAGCSSRLPPRCSKLQRGSATSMSLGERVQPFVNSFGVCSDAGSQGTNLLLYCCRWLNLGWAGCDGTLSLLLFVAAFAA